jgi:hypothetical protein
MHKCEPCKYSTETSHNLKIHCKSKKHLSILNGIKEKEANQHKSHVNIDTQLSNIDMNEFYHRQLLCRNCKKKYKYQSVYNRHIEACIYKPSETDNNYDPFEIEICRIKKECEYKLEIQHLKYELSKK